jgi:hypothetical protein
MSKQMKCIQIYQFGYTLKIEVTMKYNFLLSSALLVLSVSAHAAYTGPNNLPWRAWADIANNTSSHSGIAVTAATQSQCITQFQNAMNSHAYHHGDTFSNIHYCSYVSIGGVFGGYHEVMLDTELGGLEDEYNINEYLEKKNAALEKYYESVEVLPAVPNVRRK